MFLPTLIAQTPAPLTWEYTSSSQQLVVNDGTAQWQDATLPTISNSATDSVIFQFANTASNSRQTRQVAVAIAPITISTSRQLHVSGDATFRTLDYGNAVFSVQLLRPQELARYSFSPTIERLQEHYYPQHRNESGSQWITPERTPFDLQSAMFGIGETYKVTFDPQGVSEGVVSQNITLGDAIAPTNAGAVRSVGSLSYGSLQPGRYYLVVSGRTSGDSGSSMAITFWLE